ncbi:MAG TPA: hypothetical protein VIL84_04880 [Devosiaceae bacterium]
MPIALPIGPFDASLSRRIEWLETQVINPAQKLLGALQPEQRPHFSDWPEEYAIKNPIDLDSMSSEIEGLLDYSIRLHASLKSQLEQNVSHLSEMRYDIVYELVQLLQSHFPEIRLSRGEYYTELGKTIGTVPDFVRAAYEEITGSGEKLDAPIKSTIQLLRKSRRKLR